MGEVSVTDILDQIDQTIHDYSVSQDAARYVPGGAPEEDYRVWGISDFMMGALVELVARWIDRMEPVSFGFTPPEPILQIDLSDIPVIPLRGDLDRTLEISANITGWPPRYA